MSAIAQAILLAAIYATGVCDGWDSSWWQDNCPLHDSTDGVAFRHTPPLD